MKKILQITALFLLFTLSTAGIMNADSSYFQELQAEDEDPDDEMQDSFVLTLSDLGVQKSFILRGPYQEAEFVFSLPFDWEVKDPITIELNIVSKFQSLMEVFTEKDFTEEISYKEGFLSVDLNEVRIGEVTLNDSIELVARFKIPPSALFKNARENKLVISWDSSNACEHSVSAAVSLDPSSNIRIPYALKEMDLLISAFPKPFYSGHDINPYPVALVLPDDPDENDFSALLAISAGLGKLTNNDFSFEILYMDELNLDNHQDYHLIVFGKIDAINDFITEKMNGKRIEFPSGLEGGDNGLLTYSPSPWNSGRIMLIITGENETALEKSSAVIAADNLLTFLDGNEAVIKDLSDPLSKAQLQIDRELGELVGEEELRTSTLGETTIEIPFFVQGDITISPESYLELYFRHSQLINYLQSGITVSINDNLVGTIRFGDHTSENGLARIILPPNVVRPLNNMIEISFNITSQDLCADERSGNYWISVFGDSYLHLPPILEEQTWKTNHTLEDIPAVFLDNSSFSNLKFVVNQNDNANWKRASRIAYSLGNFTNANIMRPSARFPSPEMEITNGTIYILIGPTDESPFSGGINDYLPLPFNENGTFDDAFFNGIQYEIDARQSFGILEITDLHDTQSIVMGLFGNSDKGIEAAFSSFVEKIESFSGHYANVELINNEGIRHVFLVEQELPAENGVDISNSGWIKRFSNRIGDDAVLVVLFVMITVTIIYSIWAVKKK